MEAEPIWQIRVSDNKSKLFLHYSYRDLGEEPLGFMIENHKIRQGLHQAVVSRSNISLVAPASVTASERNAGCANVTLADNRQVCGQLIVGADGANSQLRRHAKVGAFEKDYGQTALVLTVEHERPHRGIANEHFRPSGPFAILPLNGNRSSLVWVEARDHAHRLYELPTDLFDVEMAERFGDFLGGVKSVGPRWKYDLRLIHAHQYTDHRLALIGDAAHTIHPLAGQNLNLSLRDAAVLAEELVEGARLGLDIGQKDLLERYESRRRSDNLALIAVTDSLNRLFSNDLLPLRIARGYGLAAVNRIPPLKRLLMRHARGTTGDTARLA